MKTYRLYCSITDNFYDKKAINEDEARKLLAFELNVPIQSILVTRVMR